MIHLVLGSHEAVNEIAPSQTYCDSSELFVGLGKCPFLGYSDLSERNPTPESM